MCRESIAKRLSLDETKLKEALANNASAVFQVFAATSQVALTTPGDVSSISGVPTKKVSGVYSITSDGSGTLGGTFTPTSGPVETLTSGAITAGGSTSGRTGPPAGSSRKC